MKNMENEFGLLENVTVRLDYHEVLVSLDAIFYIFVFSISTFNPLLL